ncbi:hypothetical protein H1Q63_29810 [Desmonostoc muscorum CCALA 125]|nr:hypothetical protein [Desmonostoc muscorum CCALA 125]
MDGNLYGSYSRSQQAQSDCPTCPVRLTEASSRCQQVLQHIHPHNARVWHLLGLTAMQFVNKQQV